MRSVLFDVLQNCRSDGILSALLVARLDSTIAEARRGSSIPRPVRLQDEDSGRLYFSGYGDPCDVFLAAIAAKIYQDTEISGGVEPYEESLAEIDRLNAAHAPQVAK